ncbi:MAG: DHA2 family efflux MFS transporter permease subunit [Bacteroidia bacterium]
MAYKGFAKWIVVITVVSAAVMELLDTSIVNVALNQMSGNLGASIEDISWVITAYAIANVIVIPLTGFFAAYFGRKNYYIVSIIVFTIASYLCGNSTSLWELVFFRFVQGIGGGALLSTSQAILFDAFTYEERPIASALFGMGIVMGPTLGPTLGGIIIDHYSWPLIFNINIPIGIIAVLLTIAYVEKKPEEHAIDKSKLHVDYTGILFLIIGIGSMQVVLERGQTDDWLQSAYIRNLIISSIAGLALFIWWELRHPSPAVNLRVMKNRTLAVSSMLTFVSGIGLFCSVFVIPLLVQRISGFTPTLTGELLIPGALAAFVMFPIVGKSIQNGVPARTFVAIGFSMFIAYSWFASKLNADANYWDFQFPLILRGIGISMLTVPLINQAVSDLKPFQMPQGIAINNMARQLGGSFGIAMINTYIASRVANHRNVLITNITDTNPLATERFAQLQQGFISKGYGLIDAKNMAMAAMNNMVVKQSFLLSYLDAFLFVGLFFLVTFPLIFLVKVNKRNVQIAAKAAAEAH